MSKQKLAEAILAAAKFHEENYDHVAAKAAMVSESPSQIIDYSKFYAFNLQEACERVAGEFAQPTYLLLTTAWNEAIEWAEAVVSTSDR